MNLSKFAMGLVLVTGFAAGAAEKIVAFRGGEYQCRAEKNDKYFKSKSPYQVKLSHDNGAPSTFEMSEEDGRWLKGSMSGSAYVFDEKGTLLRQAQQGYALTEMSEDFKAMQLTVAVRREQGVYENSQFQCEATRQPDVKEDVPKTLECVTIDSFEKSAVHFKFKLAFLDDPENFSVISASRSSNTTTGPVQVTPKNSFSAAINENLSGSVNKKSVRLFGDSDGVYTVELVLYRDSGLKNGWVKISHTSDGEKDSYSRLTCSVE